MWLHGNLGLLMNTTYPLWFESFHPAEKIQKASLPAPAAFLYPSQWFTPTQLLYLINKHLTTAAGLGVLTLERPRQAWAGHQLWQQETAPETTLRKQQLQKPSQSRHKGLPIFTLVWGIRACQWIWATYLFAVGSKDCYQHISDSGLVDILEWLFRFLTYNVLVHILVFQKSFFSLQLFMHMKVFTGRFNLDIYICSCRNHICNTRCMWLNAYIFFMLQHYFSRTSSPVKLSYKYARYLRAFGLRIRTVNT